MRLSRDQITKNVADFDANLVSGGDQRSAAVALVIAAVEGIQGIWLTKRNPKLRAHSGQWALPGRRLADGETVEQAALRELHEELGISLNSGAIIGRLDDYQTRSGYVISPVVLWSDDGSEPRVNEDEVARLEHITFDDLQVEPRFVEIPESDRPVIQLPLCDTLIHAPTAALMFQFSEVALNARPTRVAHLEQPVFAWK